MLAQVLGEPSLADWVDYQTKLIQAGEDPPSLPDRFEVSSEGRLQPQCCLSHSMQKLILPGPRPAPPLQKPQPGQSWLPRKEAAVTVVFCDEAERPYHALLRSTPRPDKFQPFGFPTSAWFPIEDPPIPKHSSMICPQNLQDRTLASLAIPFSPEDTDDVTNLQAVIAVHLLVQFFLPIDTTAFSEAPFWLDTRVFPR